MNSTKDNTKDRDSSNEPTLLQFLDLMQQAGLVPSLEQWQREVLADMEARAAMPSVKEAQQTIEWTYPPDQLTPALLAEMAARRQPLMTVTLTVPLTEPPIST